MKLRTELIYEAALDDELFAELPTLIAKSMGARSCVLHWRDQNGVAEIFTHSGYFSDGQMADYASNFVAHDLWTDAGMQLQRVNQAWNVSDIVANSDYDRSIFYNDWIRRMGDDTYHCVGSVMQTSLGQGIVGLHRGKTQADFPERAIAQLNGQVDHLRRMFAIRGRIGGLAERSNLLDAIFTSGQQPAFVLDRSGGLLMANAAGDGFLRSGRFLRSRKGQFGPVLDEDRNAYETAASEAARMDDPQASECLLRARDGSVVMASLLPLPPTSRAGVLVRIDEPRKRLPREVAAAHLQRGYHLSAAEADVALRLGDGESIREISDARRSAIGTVRTQVKHILSKMDAKRQADIVRKVAACWA